MRIGELRHRIDILKRVQKTNSIGESTDTWITDRTVQASVKPSKGDRSENAGQDTGNANASIVMRYRPLDYSNRIYFPQRKQTFEIVSIEADNRSTMLTVEVMELRNA